MHGLHFRSLQGAELVLYRYVTLSSDDLCMLDSAAVTPACQIALFLLQRPRPPDVLSVHVATWPWLSKQLSVFGSRFLVNQDSYFVVKCISEF